MSRTTILAVLVMNVVMVLWCAWHMGASIANGYNGIALIYAVCGAVNWTGMETMWRCLKTDAWMRRNRMDK